MTGHSIGEYVAAHLAGVFSLADALAVVAARGRLMQALPPRRYGGRPFAGDRASRPLLSDGVEIAAENAPGLCTISGPAEPLADVLRRLESAGGTECRPLRTSHAFHSSMMDEALSPFARVLRDLALAPPTIPVQFECDRSLDNRPSKRRTPTITPRICASPCGSKQASSLAANPSLFFLEVGRGDAWLRWRGRPLARNGPTSLRRRCLARVARKATTG